MEYAVLVKHDEKIFLMMAKVGDTWNIQGFESEAAGLAFFEKGYNANHRRSHVASMSACIYHLQFQPHVFKIDMKNIQRLVGTDPHLFSLQGEAGFMTCIECLGPDAQAIYDAAVMPQLVETY